jgi:glycosyltransferase involved in cell wall biosynthesis
MRVIVNANPLSFIPCGTRTYTHNLLNALHFGFDDLRVHLISHRAAAPQSPVEQNTRAWPEINNFKQKLIWEVFSFAAVTFRLPEPLIHTPYHSTTIWTKQASIMTIFDAILWESPPSSRLAARVDAELLVRAGKNARIVLTVSEYSKSRLIELLGIKSDRIMVTPLAAGSVFNAHPDGLDEISRLRTVVGLTRPYILYAGGTAERKGILQLLQAYDALRDELRAEFDLVIVGKFDNGVSHHAAILGLASKPRKTGAIHFTGVLTDAELAMAYRGSSVFVFPSFVEGFGLPPLEAMSCGAPVIVSNRTSLPEVVADAALFIDPADIASISTALQSVLESADLRNELTARSLARAAQFSWANTAALTMAAYERALS